MSYTIKSYDDLRLYNSISNLETFDKNFKILIRKIKPLILAEHLGLVNFKLDTMTGFRHL